MKRPKQSRPVASVRVFMVAIDDSGGRRYVKATIDEAEAVQWKDFFNDFSSRGGIAARAKVLPIFADLPADADLPAEARPQRAARKSARRAAVA